MKQKQKIILGLLLFFGLFSYGFADVFVTENTENWLGYADDCISAESNHITVTPTTIPVFWTGNTVYDFEAGTYDLTAGISITESCTALIGNNNVIINGNGSTVITSSNTYNIIKDLTINGNGADAISFSTTNSNTINNTIIYGSNRGLLFTTATNNIIKDSKLFGNIIGISLLTNSNDNIFNNIITFNNSQNGFFINGGSRNTINNSLSFNNTLYGLLIQAGTQNIFNNSLLYNNASNGIRIVAGNYINKSNIFNNVGNVVLTNSTGYGLIQSDVALPVGLKFGLSTDPILGSIGWQDGSVNTGLITTGLEILNPHDGTNYLIDISSDPSTRKGAKTFGTIFNVGGSKFGINLPNQIQPIKRNIAGTQLELSSIPFSASKKIGEIAIVGGSSGGGTITVTETPICGNYILESGEQCDDGNKWNGDGCTTTCQLEQSGVCGNGILEYMEWCDDGNTNNNDGCSSTCQIDSESLVLTPKQLLQQTALQKTIGLPPAIVEIQNMGSTAEFILTTITQHQQQQTEQCQYTDKNYRLISFDDINNSLYKQQIETLLNYCIIQGKLNGTQRIFGSKDTTTYAEFIKVLVRSHFLGSSVDFHNNTFDIQKVYSDVSKDSWYAPYIIKAYVHDLLLPIEKLQNKTLSISPEKNITRLDAIKILIHSLKLSGKEPQNIEIITDTFKDANKLLTREEMAALIVYGYQLDYNNSLRIRSDNPILIKLLAKHIQKYPQSEQVIMLRNIINRIEKLNEHTLKKFNIYKKELLADLATLIDFSEVFLK